MSLAVLGGGWAATGFASAGHAGAAKRCKSGQVKQTITYVRRTGGPTLTRRVCGPRPRPLPASLAASVAAFEKQSRKVALRLAPRPVKRVLRGRSARRLRAADARVDAALGAALGARFAPVARAARVTTEETGRTTSHASGTTTVERQVVTDYDADEPEPGREVVETQDTRSTRIAGLSSSRSQRIEMGHRMSRCPDANGVGHGRVRAVGTEQVVADRPGGGQAVITARFTFDAKLTAQFDDSASIVSVASTGEYVWRTTTTLAGRTVGDHTTSAPIASSPLAGGASPSVDFRSGIATTRDELASPDGFLTTSIALHMVDSLGTLLVAEAQSRAQSGKCLRIVGDPAEVHVVEGGQVELGALLKDFDGNEATGLVRAGTPSAGGTVFPGEADANPRAGFTYIALASAPSGRRDVVPFTHRSKRGKATPGSVTVIYDEPPPPPVPPVTRYAGAISGTWTGQATGEEWTFDGTIAFAYLRQAFTPPPGAPPGSYREFDVEGGGADVSVTAVSPFDGCGFTGSGHVDFTPHQGGALYAQEGDTPWYYAGMSRGAGDTIEVTKTGSDPGCDAGEKVQYPVPGVYIQMESSRQSGSPTLAGEEDSSTPETPFDYDVVTRWNLSPAPAG